jgi:hypothetical protein
MKKMFTLISLFILQTSFAQISYSVDYKVVKQTCHFCQKDLTTKFPLKIYNIGGAEPANILAIEVANFFQSSLKVQKFEDETCFSLDSKSDKHVFNNSDMKSSNITNRFQYSNSEASNYVNKGPIQEFGALYPNSLREAYSVVLAAYKK